MLPLTLGIPTVQCVMYLSCLAVASSVSPSSYHSLDDVLAGQAFVRCTCVAAWREARKGAKNAQAMLSAMDMERRWGSCATTPIWRRYCPASTSVRSFPSTRICVRDSIDYI